MYDCYPTGYLYCIAGVYSMMQLTCRTAGLIRQLLLPQRPCLLTLPAVVTEAPSLKEDRYVLYCCCNMKYVDCCVPGCLLDRAPCQLVLLLVSRPPLCLPERRLCCTRWWHVWSSNWQQQQQSCRPQHGCHHCCWHPPLSSPASASSCYC